MKTMQVLGVRVQRSLVRKRAAEGEFDQATRQKVFELHDIIDRLVLKVLVRGFHGEAAVKFDVHDGVIHLIREQIARSHR